MVSALRRNVDSIRVQRGLSEFDLSRRVGRPTDEVNRLLDEERNVPKGLIDKLAEELLVPDFTFFMEQPRLETAILDFRDANPGSHAFAKNTLKAIESARRTKKAAEGLGGFKANNKLANVVTGSEIVARAASLRNILKIDDDDQLAAKDARIFYNTVRQKVEALDVFVAQNSFDDGGGFCLTSKEGYDYICVNTKSQNYSRRLFTLGHEIYHCILDKTGLSDPEITKNDVEVKCNKFSAEFLAPRSLIQAAAKRTITESTLDLSELRSFSLLTKLSMHASVHRLKELDFYSATAVAQWYGFLSSSSNPDASAKKQGGRRVEEWKYKLARYGFKFASVFGSAVQQEQIDDLDVFRISRLKPPYQSDYFNKVPLAVPEDVEDD